LLLWQHLARTLDDEGTSTTGDIGSIELAGVALSRQVRGEGVEAARFAPSPSAAGLFRGHRRDTEIRSHV
jgi:hypothetical protein